MLTCTWENGDTSHLRHVTVDSLIVKDGNILLAKRGLNLQVEPGKWVTPGGYLERDESAAEAAARETREETGYEVNKVTLFGIIDAPRLKGDDRQNVGFIFIVEVGNQIDQPDWETDSVKWFALDKLPPAREIGFDHAKTIAAYKRFAKRPFPLPLINF